MGKTLIYSIRMRSARTGVHVSGAEGLYEKSDVLPMIREYTQRAFHHDKGRADEVRITIEELKERPLRIASLPVWTLRTRNAEGVRKAALKILTGVGITERAVEEAFKSLTMGITMRGAMLMDIEGVRLEPDLLRGVRVSRMGITKLAAASLSRKLARFNLNNATVKEALILASKVHRFPMVLGELCISDDPNYTTGYIASRRHGYIRLPHIKKRGTPFGGRAFFITGGEVKDLIAYLQTTPVIINRTRPVNGAIPVKDFLERTSHRKSHRR